MGFPDKEQHIQRTREKRGAHAAPGSLPYNRAKGDHAMAQTIMPTQYELKAAGVLVGYSTSSITGEAQLSFKKGRTKLNFTGNEIGLLQTTIGTLITVTIASRPDQSFTTFSFLLPTIQLSKQSDRQSFRTIGVTTINKTTIAGPVKGVQQVYKSVELRGSARQVQFLAYKTAGA
jgi:hypothetical protein